MRREKLRSERAQLYFLLFFWNNSLMNTDIILVFLVSVYLMCLVKTQSNQETRSTIQVRYAESSEDAFLSRGT